MWESGNSPTWTEQPAADQVADQLQTSLRSIHELAFWHVSSSDSAADVSALVYF